MLGVACGFSDGGVGGAGVEGVAVVVRMVW